MKPGTQQIEISVDPHDIRFENHDGQWRADFDLILSQKAPDGRRLAGERSQCLVDRETLADTQSNPLYFRRDVAIGHDAVSLRILVRDSANGAVGSLAIPIAPVSKLRNNEE